ncbi:hypothetical protein BS17DRAFT_764774 [Gyrodon lividus]|nr:hypothetical protein BS17DRAFT_764774 [Gyrodon lividus]
MHLIGQATLQGLSPVKPPILQHLSCHAAQMEADSFNLEEISGVNAEAMHSAFHAIVMVPVDRWWLDAALLELDPNATHWEYMPNLHQNDTLWCIIQGICQQSSLLSVEGDIRVIQADIATTSELLAGLLANAPSVTLSTLEELKHMIVKHGDIFGSEHLSELAQLLVQHYVEDP